MRFKSKQVDGLQVFAVSGTNTVTFGIDASTAARKQLLGLAVERIDPVEDERYFMPGFKGNSDQQPILRNVSAQAR